ncbi:MAG: hypothetical protein WCG91_02480 [Candidatus Shapirobacteria bacterium]
MTISLEANGHSKFIEKETKLFQIGQNVTIIAQETNNAARVIIGRKQNEDEKLDCQFEIDLKKEGTEPINKQINYKDKDGVDQEVTVTISHRTNLTD